MVALFSITAVVPSGVGILRIAQTRPTNRFIDEARLNSNHYKGDTLSRIELNEFSSQFQFVLLT